MRERVDGGGGRAAAWDAGGGEVGVRSAAGRAGGACLHLGDTGLKGQGEGRCAALQSAAAQWPNCP